MRRAFAQTLLQEARLNPRIALVTGDLGFQVFDEFHVLAGRRYVNVGVAEAQMIYTAAGMALEGWRPIAYSIASFATARPFEQIRYCVCYPKLPVLLVGAGRGYLYGTSGVSHHAADDIALMSLLPNMTVVIPGDPVEIQQLLPQLLEAEGPAYFTVGRFGEKPYSAEEPAALGKARRLRSGDRIAILSTGEIAQEVVKALDVLAAEGIRPAAYQFHTVKPLDAATLKSLATQFPTLLVVEEHVPIGGLWAAILAALASHSPKGEIHRLGAPDAFALGNPSQALLRARLQIDAAAIAEHCRLFWSRI